MRSPVSVFDMTAYLSSGRIVSARVFDTYRFGPEALSEFVHSVKRGRIIIAVTADDAWLLFAFFIGLKEQVLIWQWWD